MKLITVHENEKRKIMRILDENTGCFEYVWIDSKGLIRNPANFQNNNTKLHLSNEQLQELFPSIRINTTQKRVWNNEKQKILILPL